MEMVDSLVQWRSPRSDHGEGFPNFEMLDAKRASALTKIIQNYQFKKKVSLEERNARKRGSVATASKTGDWHQFHRKPTSGRGVVPPQHEQEAGRRVAGHQTPGKMHLHERAEVLCDFDSYNFST